MGLGLKSPVAIFMMLMVVSGFLLAGVTSFGLAQDPASFTISGYILDSDGNGLSGAEIIFSVPTIVPSVRSDSSGYYEASAPAGTYRLRVWPPFDSSYISYDEQDFAVESDISKNITLTTGYKISGYITGSLGQPVVKAIVSLDNFFCGWYSNYSGYYFVTAPAGTYTLFAKPADGPQGVTDFYTNNEEQTNYEEHNITVNGDLEKDFTVKTHTEISGYVLDEEGNGLAGASVIFGVPDIVPAVHTNDSGYYKIYAPRGAYHVNVWPPFDSNYLSYDEPEFIVGTSDFSENITLSSGYKLSGYLTDYSGAPIRGALALLDQFYCGWYSDSSGYYFVTAPAGTYNLTIQPRTGPSFPTYTENNFTITGDTIKNFTLTSPKTTLSDNFDDGVADGWTQRSGSWNVINGEYCVSVDLDGVTTVDGLDLADYTISTKLRFTDSVGFRAGIIFRFVDPTQYYFVHISKEYDSLGISKYTPENQYYGYLIAHYSADKLFQKDVDYQLKIIVSGNLFRCFIDGEEVLNGTDSSYTHGGVGLRARQADACFDNFKIENATISPSPEPTHPPDPTPNPSLPSYSDDFSTDSGAWQYLGSAYRNQTNGWLVLTESVRETAGAAWFKAPIQGSFTASFRYKTFGGNKGDGFTLFFFKKNYSSLGIGGSLGFTTYDHEIVPGYGIEFDGWRNSLYDFQLFDGGEINPPDGDPSPSHIALIEGYVGNHLAYVDDDRIGDNRWHQVFVQVQTSSVRVFVDQELVLEWSGVLNRTYDGFGFSGADGGVGTNWHIIDDFSISADNLENTALTVSSSVNGEKTWQDPTTVNPASDGILHPSKEFWTWIVAPIIMIPVGVSPLVYFRKREQ